eukprot:GHVS01096232.1.p1 GENE.GHVS01096232.1~~GHVS01096232.1.p1  ORF type:complete len:150 (+),score=31.29 GHVS01096232.1:186-635(+)
MTRAMKDLPEAVHFIHDPATDVVGDHQGDAVGFTTDAMWLNLVEARLRINWYRNNNKLLMDYKTDIMKIFRFCRELHRDKPSDFPVLKDCAVVEDTFNDLWDVAVRVLARSKPARASKPPSVVARPPDPPAFAAEPAAAMDCQKTLLPF